MKKNSLKLNFIGLSVFAVILSACHKDKSDTTSVTVNNLAGTYKLKSMTLKGNDGSTVDLYASLQDCEKNATIILNKDMSYEEKDDCTPPMDQTGTWSLPSSTTINVDGENADIVSFDGHNLTLSFTDTNGKVIETMSK